MEKKEREAQLKKKAEERKKKLKEEDEEEIEVDSKLDDYYAELQVLKVLFFCVIQFFFKKKVLFCFFRHGAI